MFESYGDGLYAEKAQIERDIKRLNEKLADPDYVEDDATIPEIWALEQRLDKLDNQIHDYESDNEA